MDVHCVHILGKSISFISSISVLFKFSLNQGFLPFVFNSKPLSIFALVHPDIYQHNLLCVGYIRLLESVKKREGSKALLIIKIFIYCDFPNKKRTKSDTFLSSISIYFSSINQKIIKDILPFGMSWCFYHGNTDIPSAYLYVSTDHQYF